MFDFSTPITKDTTLVGVWDCSPIDPSNPTFEMVKAVLDFDDPASVLPIGTEIPDTWNGNSNPMIVGHYTTINGKKAVGLLRKYIEPAGQTWGSDINYKTSTILDYLNSTYLDNCSDALKAAISATTVKWYVSSALVDVSGKWHLFSGIEVCGTPNTGEGEQWAYWKNVTGLSSASDSNNAGRVKQDRNGTNTRWWLRSWYTASYVWRVGAYGNLYGDPSSNSFGVLPACWIIAD